MSSNNRNVHRNGTEQHIYSNNAIYPGTFNNHIPNSKQATRRMEAKLILGIFTGLGITSYIWAVILNIGSWKGDVLFGIAVLFGILKVLRYGMKTWQDYRMRELEIREKRRQQANDIFS